MKIIKKNYEFTRIFRRGKKGFDQTPMSCLAYKKKERLILVLQSNAKNQYGCTQRNHLKRLLREIARNSSLNSCLGLDIILIARGKFSELNYHILQKDFEKLFKQKYIAYPAWQLENISKKKYRFHAKQKKRWKKLILKQIRNYQLEISPKPPRTEFYPTCSQYAYEAIEMNGLFLGSLQAFWRLLR